MSKPVPKAAAQYHKCPDHKDSLEIRVKGFAHCPFCGAKINADGDHNVVVAVDAYRPAQHPAQPKLEPIPEPPKSEPPPQPAPEQPLGKSADEIREVENRSGPSKRRGSLWSLLIFTVVILGGLYAWTRAQSQSPILAQPGLLEGNPSDPGGAGIELADIEPLTSYSISPVEPDLTARAKITLRIRSTPSRLDDYNVMSKKIAVGEIFTPQGLADDIGKDPGRRWYKVPGGFVAEWETVRIMPTSAQRPPSRSPDLSPGTMAEPVAPEIDAGDLGQTSTTRALDAAPPAATPAPPPRPTLSKRPSVGRRFKEPEYPAASRRAGEEGETRVSVCVDTDGRMSNVKIVKSSGFERLDDQAIKALTNNRLDPAIGSDGKPIAMCDPYPYEFTYVWTLKKG